MTESVAPGPDLDGARMFVRYAYPPNALGYCGPDGFRDYAEAGVVDQGLVKQVQAFSGAWPYLELISSGCSIRDPLDRRVVEAYWVGNDLLDRVALGQLGDSMAARFRKQVGNKFQFLAEGVLAGGVPHHSFHVFGVYPWVGLLGNDRMTTHALTVLDRCRVRWGKVIAVHGDQATVESRPLRWDGRLLTLGEPVHETARLALAGTGLAGTGPAGAGPAGAGLAGTGPGGAGLAGTGPGGAGLAGAGPGGGLAAGDWVALHWDWVCDKLTDRQLRALRGYSQRHLDMVNHRVDHPGTVAALG